MTTRANQNKPHTSAPFCRRTGRTTTAIALAAASIVPLSVSTIAAAADFDIPDGDVQALIDAINAANANGEANTINLAPGGVYTLTEVYDDKIWPTGLPIITGEMAIYGNGATLRPSDDEGTPTVSILLVGEEGDVVLNDVVITGAITIGVINFGGILEVVDSSISGNSTVGIASGFGSTTVVSSSITDNIGAGIDCYKASLTLIDSIVTGNGCQDLAGVTIVHSSAIITNTALSADANAQCTFHSRGIYVEAADLVVNGCTISDNSTSEGGAIYSCCGSTVTVIDSTLIGNSASKGGGIRTAGGTLNVIGTTISNNFAPEGGGIHSTSSTVTVAKSNISGNGNIDGVTTGVLWSGGGIYAGSGELTVTDSVISDNRASAFGGGIDCPKCELTVLDSAIIGNETTFTSGEGGGVNKRSNAPATFVGCTIADNTAGRGSGIYNHSAAPLNVDACTIRSNAAILPSSGTGGGIFIAGTGGLFMSRTAIHNNTAMADGGGIYGFANILLTNCTVSGNVAGVNGGGIRVLGFPGSVTNCTITGNSATSGGGAMWGPLAGAFTFDNSIVSGNSVGGDIVGNYTDLGHNIVEDGSGIPHPASMNGDPLLGPLADNGGPTWTHALLPGSPAIDAGDCAGGTITHDQRGVPRPQGKACDIGAFERKVITILGDLNSDSVVSVTDLLIMLGHWGECPANTPDEIPPTATDDDCFADLNGDNVVDDADLLILLANWG